MSWLVQETTLDRPKFETNLNCGVNRTLNTISEIDRKNNIKKSGSTSKYHNKKEGDGR